MKLEKAIEILRDHVDWCDPVKEKDTYDALKLGIEAGKCVLAIRHHPFPDSLIQLPGETEEHCKYCGLAHTGVECPSREGEK